MKISLIIAVYNSEKYIRRCLTSIMSPELPSEEVEIVIVDDASTDNSVDIVRECVATRDNIILLCKKENEGTFLSRIDGMKAASGDYIGFVDGDDWISPQMLWPIYRGGTTERIYCRGWNIK
ncbi:MAG: glycosyltransferase family 2 protein [Lachnospiraceae bacterium]|nr:glycosyltransferase family 2 protein [Lachnospiraceae bacterium]